MNKQTSVVHLEADLQAAKRKVSALEDANSVLGMVVDILRHPQFKLESYQL